MTPNPAHRYHAPPETLTMAEAAHAIGVSRQALHQRLTRPGHNIPTVLHSAPDAMRRVVTIASSAVVALRDERIAAGQPVGPLPWPELPPHPPEVPPVPPMPRFHGIGIPLVRPF